MITPRLFPSLMPSETIHSAISRYHLLIGNLSPASSLIELFGNRSTSVTSDFPSGLGQLITLPGNDGLIDGHTLLPLFSPFLGESRSQAVREHMSGRAEKSWKFACGIMNAGFERYRAWRYCPDCILKDSLQYGVAYWHVIHQAAGVQACPEHRVPLYTLSVYGEALGGTPLMLPRSPEIQTNAAQYRFTPIQLEKAAEVATLLDWGLSHSEEVELLFARNFLNVVLCERGLVHRNRIKAERLRHHFQKTLQAYPPDDEFQRLGALCQSCPAWILGTIRRPTHTHHPLFYFALLSLLEVSASEIEEFIERDHVVEEISLSGVRVNLVNRGVSDEIKARKRAQFSEATKDKVFTKTKEYHWLYRNDREWLQAYVRSHLRRTNRRNTVDWFGRDEKLFAEIQRAKKEILSYTGRPIQVTQRSLARHLSVPVTIWRRADLLPMTTKALADSDESDHDFQLRRVRWAYEDITNEGNICTRSSVLRRAGIRVLRLVDAEFDACCS